MAGIVGRSVIDYDDFFAQDPAPRIWEQVMVRSDGSESTMFWGRCPNSHAFTFNPRHVVVREDDGSFTVSAQPTPPSGQNSIQCRECGWHGYVDHNIWTEIGS